MVEEIRTLLLNSNNFKKYVYFPEDYSERKLNKTFKNFRDALLKMSKNDTEEVQAWRAKKIVNLIYSSNKLNKIAFSLFDTRKIQNDTELNSSLESTYSININHPNLVINTRGIEESPSDSIYIKKITFTKISSNQFSLSYNYKQNSSGDILSFVFGSGLSDLKRVPDTNIKIGFSGVSSIPSDIHTFDITIKYPFILDFNGIIERVYSIPSVEQLILSNSSKFNDLYSVYTTSSRDHEKILCLLMGYALSLK
jgi:hypothetical protein